MNIQALQTKRIGEAIIIETPNGNEAIIYPNGKVERIINTPHTMLGFTGKTGQKIYNLDNPPAQAEAPKETE